MRRLETATNSAEIGSQGLPTVGHYPADSGRPPEDFLLRPPQKSNGDFSRAHSPW